MVVPVTEAAKIMLLHRAIAQDMNLEPYAPQCDGRMLRTARTKGKPEGRVRGVKGSDDMTPKMRQVFGALHDSVNDTVAKIADETGLPKDAVGFQLTKLHKMKKIKRLGYKRWGLI